MDETAVCLFQGKGKGNIVLAKGIKTSQNLPKWKQRASLTHVAFVCDNPRVQSALPQVIIGNERTLPAKQMATLRSRCPPNVRLLRAKSAWVNGQICGQLVRWLAAALSPFWADFQPMLMFDACKSHTCPAVWRACSVTRIWPLLVPAQLTWLLQPLDTHAFSLYKLHLQKAYQAMRILTDDGVVGVAELLESVYIAIREVLESSEWATAFDRDGFGTQQAGVSQRVLKEMQLDVPVVVSAARPVAAQLAACFPKRSWVPVTSLWRSVDAPAAPIVFATSSSSSPASAAAPPIGSRLIPPSVGRPSHLVSPCCIALRARSRA